MLLHDVDEVVEGLVAVENLALAVLHIALQVEGRRLVDAEIFQRFGHCVAHFLGDAEEMVDGIAAREDDASVFGEFDVFLSEFARGDIIKFDEFLKSEVDTILFHHVSKRRLRYICRLGLRHQN